MASGSGSYTSSASMRRDISSRPPRTTNSTTAISRFTTRLVRKTVTSPTGRSLSRITELVIVP